jgi:hypothetical protein
MATIDVETEYANPQGAVELKIGGPFSIGASYAQSKNEFTGEWIGDDGDSNGSADAKRTDVNAYLRLGSRDSVNFRLGYRYFKYEFTDGLITSPEEIDRNGTAKGDLSTGIDGELNLVFGDKVQFGMGIAGDCGELESTWPLFRTIWRPGEGGARSPARMDRSSSEGSIMASPSV